MILRNTRQYLLSVVNITTLVASRVFPNVIPQNIAMPAIRLSLIGGSPYTRHGTVLIGKARSNVQIDAYASDYATAEALASAIRVACHQYKGQWGALHAAAVYKTDERTWEDMPEDGSSSVRRIVSQDFEIVHTESTS